MPFKCQMSYQAFRGFKTSLQWSEPWCLHSFTYRPRKTGFVCFCFEHCSNIQEFFFFFIFQERNYFVKQRKLHFVLFRTWHFHINLSKYIYSSVFWYRARNLFFPPFIMSFDRSHWLYFLHKYQNVSTISSSNFLKLEWDQKDNFSRVWVPNLHFSSRFLDCSFCAHLCELL